jgi:hypothetical protein
VNGRSDTGTGVLASSSSGIALEVLGTAKFSTAGGGTIGVGQDAAFVSNAAVTNESHITATLMGTPGPVISGFPAVIQWVERRPGLGFVVHLTRRVGQATPFTYLIVEPVSSMGSATAYDTRAGKSRTLDILSHQKSWKQ